MASEVEFDDNNLPIAKIPIENFENVKKTEFKLDNPQEFEDLEQILKGFVEGDCWAVKVNEDILFNLYNDNMGSSEEMIQQQMMRDAITLDPKNTILWPTNQRYEDAKMMIFLNAYNPHTITIRYSSQDFKCNLSFHKALEGEDVDPEESENEEEDEAEQDERQEETEENDV